MTQPNSPIVYAEKKTFNCFNEKTHNTYFKQPFENFIDQKNTYTF